MEPQSPDTTTVINLDTIARKAGALDDTVSYFLQLAKTKRDFADIKFSLTEKGYSVNGVEHLRWYDAFTALLAAMDSKRTNQIYELERKAKSKEENRFSTLEQRMDGLTAQVAAQAEKLAQVEARKIKEIELGDGSTMHVEDAPN